MKNHKNNKEVIMDEQLRDFFATQGKEPAPDDFTQNLLHKIEQEKREPFVYKPVISKAAWIAISVVLVIILLVAVFLVPATSSVPAGWEKLSGMVNFQFSESFLPHLQTRFLQGLSQSHVLVSILAVALALCWHYLFMRSRNMGKRNRFTGRMLF